MKDFEKFKNEAYIKDPQISLQTIIVLYEQSLIVKTDLDEKPKNKKTSKK